MQKKQNKTKNRNNITVKHTYEPMCFKGNIFFLQKTKNTTEKNT